MVKRIIAVNRFNISHNKIFRKLPKVFKIIPKCNLITHVILPQNMNRAKKSFIIPPKPKKEIQDKFK